MEETLMLVGAVAKRLGVSVRTLQYYDKEKLCSPEGFSEGGRRLYCNKDIVKLHQILSMKYLNLSLAQIKNNLPKLETTAEVTQMLNAQNLQISQQIDNLSKAQKAINLLIEEVGAIDKVDWTKYANIIDMLKLDDSKYWIVKHFDNKTLQNAANKFDQKSAEVFVSKIEGIWDSFGALIDSNITPDSRQSVELAKQMWDMIMEFSSGDKDILRDVLGFGQSLEDWKDETWKNKFAKIQDYSEKALESYFIEYNIEVNL